MPARFVAAADHDLPADCSWGEDRDAGYEGDDNCSGGKEGHQLLTGIQDGHDGGIEGEDVWV